MDGPAIAAWRKARHLSQRQLADLLGVHHVTVANWERGERGAKRPCGGGRVLDLALIGLESLESADGR